MSISYTDNVDRVLSEQLRVESAMITRWEASKVSFYKMSRHPKLPNMIAKLPNMIGQVADTFPVRNLHRMGGYMRGIGNTRKEKKYESSATKHRTRLSNKCVHNCLLPLVHTLATD